MGLYLRKSFRAGPVRFNLSKSGVGASIGVKGFRVGTSASGRSYVHAGRGGLYYRQSLSSSSRSASRSSADGLGTLLLIVLGIVIAVPVIRWITENPAIPISFGSVALIGVGFHFFIKSNKSKCLLKYKQALDKHFVSNETVPDEATLFDICKLKARATKHKDLASKIGEIDRNVYTAVLDKIIDDKCISDEEKKLINCLDSISSIGDEFKLETKKEIFRLLYLDVIADREITKEELQRLKTYLLGLNLKRSDVEKELRIIQEIIKMQKLSLPLKPIVDVPIKIQKKETPYYNGPAKVLSRKKAKKDSENEYQYSVRREGLLLVTNNRVFVVGDGTTTVNLKDILDIEVDLDNSMVVISKNNSSTPIFIQTGEPLYSAKIMDLLCGDSATR